MKLKTIIGCLLATVLLGACDEDDVETGFRNPSLNFMPAADDNSQTASLRRGFFEETGSYLLFTDTLQHVYQGEDINGESVYFTELLDMAYSVGQTTTTAVEYSYTYITDVEQQRQMVSFLKDYILTHVTGDLQPFSWFLCNRIQGKDTAGNPINVNSLTGQRCMAVACNYLLLRDRTDAQKLSYANNILAGVMGRLAYNRSDLFADFVSVSASYYGQDYPSSTKPSNEELYALGFLSSISAYSYPSLETDLSTYVSVIIRSTEEQIEAQYGSYPLVMQKFRALRVELVQAGFKF